MSNTTVSACGGTFYDSGGPGGDYSNNETYVMTFCPSEPNTVVRLDFTQYWLDFFNSDALFIYDGPDVSSPLLAISVTTMNSGPGTVQATANNSSGCITVRFVSNANGTYDGWKADISCVPVCQQITAVLESSTPAAEQGIIRICQGEQVDFNGSALFSVSDQGAAYEWDFDNGQTATGTNVSSVFDQPGAYHIKLLVTDTEFCRNSNLLELVVQVATPSQVVIDNATSASDEVCFGQPVELIGSGIPVPFFEPCEMPASGTTFIPDGNVGESLFTETSILVNCFAPGQTLTDMSQLSVCLNMEHSFVKNFSITLVSPSGESATLLPYDFDGVPYYMGIPVTVPNVDIPGIGFDYCFSMAGSATMLDFANDIVPNPNGNYMQIPAGTYLPDDPFSNLLGCSLNGLWTIKIADYLPYNNGYIFSWNLNFDQEILQTFTPEIVSESWLPDPSITAVDGNTITVNPTIPGEHCYTYTVTDNFGCTHSQTKCITVYEPMELGNPQDLTNCGGTFDLTQNIPLILDGANPSGYSFQFHHSFQDALDLADPIEDPESYNGSDMEQIFVSMEDLNSGLGCIETRNFFLHQGVAQGTVTADSDTVCQDMPFGVTFTATAGTGSFLFSYLLDGAAATASITAGNSVFVSLPTNVAGEHTVQLISLQAGHCVNPVNQSLTFTVGLTPNLPVVTNVNVCGSYDLPLLAPGHEYYDQSGNLIPQGSIITTTQNITVIAQSNLAQCNVQSSFTVTVNQQPVVISPADVIHCGPYPLPQLSVGNYYTEPLGQGTMLASGTFINETQPVYIYAVAASSPPCFSQGDFMVTIVSQPIITAPNPLVMCDDNNDGISCFNLTPVIQQLMATDPNLLVSLHETPDDAQLNVNPIDPNIYCNIMAGSQTLYIRVAYSVSSETNCPNYTSVNLIVNPVPIANDDVELQVCDDDSDGQTCFDLVSAIPQILDGLDPILHTVTFYTNEADALSENDPILSIGCYFSATDIIWATVSDNATGCADIVSVNLIVASKPIVPFPVPSLTVCDVITPDDQYEPFDLSLIIPNIIGTETGLEVTFYRNESDAVNQANSINDTADITAYVNESPAVHTLWITVTKTSTGCRSFTTVDIRVEPLPAPILPALIDPRINICDENQDGISTFDLQSLIEDMQQGVAPQQMMITFFESEDDANGNQNPIPDPAHYTNLTAFTQFIWIRAENTENGCYRVVPLTLNVTDAPVVPINLDPIVSCDDYGNDQDGIVLFDLTLREAQIIAAQTGSGPFEITYYTSEVAAQQGLLPIVPVMAYASGATTIWYRIESGDCHNVGSFGLEVNLSFDMAISLGVWSVCDVNPPSGMPTREWDLTTVFSVFPQTGFAQADYTISYHSSYGGAVDGTGLIGTPEAYVNISNAQTIGIVVADNLTGCRTITSVTIKIIPLPVVRALTANQIIRMCDTDATPGTETFDLTSNETYLSNGDTALAFHYFVSQSDAQNNQNPIVPADSYVSAAAIVWVRVERLPTLGSDGEFCYVVVPMQLQVNPLPDLAVSSYDLVGCETDGNGFTEFNLSDANDDLLAPWQDPLNFDYSYHHSQSDADDQIGAIGNFTEYINQIPYGPQTIYVRIGNRISECYETATIVLSVQAGATATAPPVWQECADDLQGTFGFDLTTLDATILSGQDSVQFTVAYFISQADALNNENAITDPSSHTSAPANLWAIVINTASAAPCTSDPVAVILDVEPLANPTITADSDILCANLALPILSVPTITNPDDYTFDWFLNGSSTGISTPTFTVFEAGNYSVMITSLRGCVSVSSDYTINSAGLPENISWTVTSAFADDQQIIVHVDGDPHDYLYSLDGGPFLDNGGVFDNVRAGVHYVVIRSQCGDSAPQGPIYTIDYPKFFTPNGDGIHDTWNIIGLDGSAKIYIFDRYGKLLKQISSLGQGWDGTYNGNPLPSTDYWFLTEYLEDGQPKEFKAHFAIKR